MKKLIVFLLVLLLVFTSCENNVLVSRKVKILIPDHPWEDDEIKLWYTLKWNDNGKIETMYVDKNTREVEISIAQNCTVFICAYPLGEMLPFGTAIIPTENKKEALLSQNEGYLAHLLLNSDLEAAEHVNFDKLVSVVEDQTFDFRTVDDSTLVADVINGCLSKDSVEIKNKIAVPDISLPNGKWICEWEADEVKNVSKNRIENLEISPGILRFYCKESDREFRVVVESNGSVFHTLRYGMIGL